jgi:hypothetical protein
MEKEMEMEIMQLLVLVAAVIYLVGDDGTTPHPAGAQRANRPAIVVCNSVRSTQS